MAKLGDIRKRAKAAEKKPAAPPKPAPRKRRTRAKEPAQPPPGPQAPSTQGPDEAVAPAGEVFTAVACRVADNWYAIRMDQVERVEMVEGVVRVPNLPDHVEGVVSIRGEAVPVLTLRRLFGLEKAPFGISTRLVVARVQGRQVGFIVDQAREIVRLGADEVQPPPEMIHGLSGDYLEGIARHGDRAFLVVDLAAVLALADEG